MTSADKRRVFIVGLVRLRDDFVAAEDAVLDLARFTVAQQANLDAEAGAIRELALRFLPESASEELQQQVYDEASKYWSRIREVQVETKDLDDASRDERRNELISAAEVELRDQLGAIGITAPIPALIYQKFRSVQARKKRAPMLMESLLITAVSQFEVFVSQLIATSLRFDDRPIKGAERRFTYSEVVDSGTSMRDFKRWVVDDFVTKLMRGSLDDWLGFISKAIRLDAELRKQVHDDLVEVVQRRHLFVHNGGKVSESYLANVGRRAAGLAAGTRLEVDSEYLLTAIERLTLAGLVLAQGAIHAVARSDSSEDALVRRYWGSINEVLFEKMLAKRWWCPSRAFPMMEDYLPDAECANLVRVNSWHSAAKLAPDVSVNKEIASWDVSSLHPRFKLAKLCLLGDVAAASEMVKGLLRSGDLKQLDVDTWPILEDVREYHLKSSSE